MSEPTAKEVEDFKEEIKETVSPAPTPEAPDVNTLVDGAPEVVSAKPDISSNVRSALKSKFPVYKDDPKDKNLIWIPVCKDRCKMCHGRGHVTGTLSSAPTLKRFLPCPKARRSRGIDLVILANAIKYSEEKAEEAQSADEKK